MKKSAFILHLASCIFLLVTVSAPAANRTIDKTWDVNNGTRRPWELQLFQADGVDLSLTSLSGSTPAELSTNDIPVWEITGYKDYTNVYAAVTGSVTSVTNGITTFTFPPADLNLDPGTYRGYIKAMTLSGTNIITRGELAYQKIKMEFSPASSGYAIVTPSPYYYTKTESDLMAAALAADLTAEAAARTGADETLTTDLTTASNALVSADAELAADLAAVSLTVDTLSAIDGTNVVELITDEATTRADADTTLAADLTTASNTLAAADTALAADIDLKQSVRDLTDRQARTESTVLIHDTFSDDQNFDGNAIDRECDLSGGLRWYDGADNLGYIYNGEMNFLVQGTWGTYPGWLISTNGYSQSNLTSIVSGTYPDSAEENQSHVRLSNGSISALYSDDGGWIRTAYNTSSFLVDSVVSPADERQCPGYGVLKGGDRFAMAIQQIGTTGQIYWGQGGYLGEFGAVVGSDVWFPLMTGALDTTGMTNYPSVYGRGRVGSVVKINEMEVVQDWEPSDSMAMFDFNEGKIGLHHPMLATDGDVVVAGWMNSTTHVATGAVSKVSVRIDDEWLPAQELTELDPTDTSTKRFLSLQYIGDQFVLFYNEIDESSTDVAYLRSRVLDVDSTGVCSLGDEITYTNFVSSARLYGRGLEHDGRIILPIQDVDNYSTIPAYSDDDGQTWTTSSIPQIVSYQVEASILEQPNGSLICYMRTEQTVAYYSTSDDNGETWSTPVATTIPMPNSTDIPTGSRQLFRSLSNGNILCVGNDSTTFRDRLCLWEIGDNAEIIKKIYIGTLGNPSESSRGIIQYPDVLIEGDTANLLWSTQLINSGGGTSGNASAIYLNHRKLEQIVEPSSGGSGLSIPADGNPSVRGSYVYLIAASTITNVLGAGTTAYTPLTMDVSLAKPEMPDPAQEYTWIFEQDSTGNRAITFDSGWNTGAIDTTATTNAAAVDYLKFRYNFCTENFDVIEFIKGY